MDKYDKEFITAGITEMENEASSTATCDNGTSEFVNAVQTNPTLIERLGKSVNNLCCFGCIPLLPILCCHT
jgi:hypothetical protein